MRIFTLETVRKCNRTIDLATVLEERQILIARGKVVRFKTQIPELGYIKMCKIRLLEVLNEIRARRRLGGRPDRNRTKQKSNQQTYRLSHPDKTSTLPNG
jgi:hypothetical protein